MGISLGGMSPGRGRHAGGGGLAGHFAASAVAREIDALVPVHQKSRQMCKMVTEAARDNL